MDIEVVGEVEKDDEKVKGRDFCLFIFALFAIRQLARDPMDTLATFQTKLNPSIEPLCCEPRLCF